MPKQALSLYAKRRKSQRDKQEAMTPRRRAMKAENQRLRRKATKAGKQRASYSKKVRRKMRGK